MKLIRKILDFYIYSSIHIAFGAALSIVLCYAVFTHIPTSDYPLFVFCATVSLYCAHRIIGISKVEDFSEEGRFAVIKTFRTHLILYAILGAIGSVYFYLGLTRMQQLSLILPAIVSCIYILPVFARKKRLRDFNLIKIFLIAIVWALVIGVIPYLEVHGRMDTIGFFFGLEKLFFIFAITLPFDIRDLKIDAANKVKTIPALMGVKNAYKLSYFSMAAVFGIIIYLFSQGVYNAKVALALAIAYQLTGFLLRLSKDKQDDYYFSGLLDGTIALVALAGIYASGILKVMF